MATIRVAVNNNFNCTLAEFAQLDKFSDQYPEHLFFINCNIVTPLLTTINDHPYKAVITVNPALSVIPDLVNRLASIDQAKIAFLRIKWLPGNKQIQDLATDLCKKYPIVLTLQRFNSKKTLLQYTELKNYIWNCSNYRLNGPALSYVKKWAKTHNTHICDIKDLGCLGCGLCATNNGRPNDSILSLNLSTSGECAFNCPSCYAKAFQKKLKAWHKPIMKYDFIHANHKQAGKTAHIRHARERLLTNGCSDCSHD